MDFNWVDIAQVGLFFFTAFVCYKLYQDKRYKSAVGVAAVFVLAFFITPVVNTSGNGYAEVEAQRHEVSTEIPERVTVEKEPSFEERVKEDLKQYEEERKNENDQ